MASVNAASTIHSQSTLSRKYDVDTSTIFNLAEQFNDADSTNKNSNSTQLLQEISLDAGRYDFHFSWINTMRLFIFPFFLMFSSLGLILIKTDEMNSISKNVYNVLRYIMIFTPEDTSFTVVLSVNLVFLVIYISLIIFLLHLIFLYKNESCPTNFQISFWLVLSRIIMPLFTTYISHIFSHSLYQLITNDIDNITVSSFIISIPLILTQILYIFFSCSVYNATPIIRSNDVSQLWFSYSRLDWMLNLILFFQALIQNLLLLISFPACTFVYFIFITAISVFLSIMIILRLPYIHPKANSVVLLASISSPFCSLFPIISYYQKNSVIGLLVLVVLIIILFFVSRLIINYRIHCIMSNFAKLSEIDPDDVRAELDPLSAAIMQLNPTRTVDFAKLNLNNEKDLSLYLRIGFLFNQQEVNNNLFIKWATDQNIKADLVLSACQVSYALQNDIRMLNTLEQLCHKLGSSPFNSHSFIIMFNHLRQGLLTQLNQPLLEAVGKAKKANRYLIASISEFWEAVLKQRLDVMTSILPEISNEMMRTNRLFQRLIRHYPKAPTVFKETVIFYHKSLGDHVKSMEAQSMYNKAKNHNSNRDSSSDSPSSTSFDDVDNDFRIRMEPWIEAQKVISGLKTPALNWLTALLIISYVSMIVIPIVVLVISLTNIRNFQTNIEPIETVGNITYSITRIPQLVRRKQLCRLNEIQRPPSSVGEPKGTLLEFFDEDMILPSLSKYDDLIKKGSDQFLSLCTSESVIYRTCIDDNHPMITGDSQKSSTAYELLMSYEVILNTIIQKGEDFDWLNANTTDEVLFIFQNYDELFNSFSNIFSSLSESMIDYSSLVTKITNIWLAVIWIFPIIIIVPIAVVMALIVKNEIKFVLKLFFIVPKNEISILRWSTKSKKNGKASRKFQQKLARQNSDSSDSGSSISATERKEMLTSQILLSRKSSRFLIEFMIPFVVFILFTMIMTSVGLYIFSASMKEIITVSNSYVQSIKVYSSALASYIWTQEIFSSHPMLYDYLSLKNKSHTYMRLLKNLFDDFFFRSKKFDLTPAILLGDDVLNTLFVSSSIDFNDSIKFDIDPVYGLVHSVYNSLSCDAHMRLLDEVSRFIYKTGEQSVNFTFNDMFVYHYEHLFFVHMNQFFLEGTVLFRHKMENERKDNVDQIVLIFVVMLSCQIIFILTVLLSAYFHLKHHILTSRYLMQLIQPESLLKSQTIVKWLSGNLTSKTRVFSFDLDRSNHSKSLLTEFVLKYTKSGLIITDENASIIKVNDIILSLFKTKESQVINRNLKEFLNEHLIDKDKGTSLKLLDNEVLKMREGASKTNKFSFYSSVIGANSQLIHLFIQVEGYNDHDDEFFEEGQFFPIARAFSVEVLDKTNECMQQNLVEVEKKKSENLIRSIMPEPITKLMNEGENDISFEVPKATVLYSNVFNWNDIIQNMNSYQVMSFLNKLFNSYDSILHRFPTVTKIKTNSDVYIAAGGLFRDSSSINSAEATTEFALKMLEAAEQISLELDMSIQITIGITTGGPLACGILGRIRPVFDIIGDIVNSAALMNSTGVPRCIHITDTTYEDIKYMNFSIREKESSGSSYDIEYGENEAKKTYLISLP